MRRKIANSIIIVGIIICIFGLGVMAYTGEGFGSHYTIEDYDRKELVIPASQIHTFVLDAKDSDITVVSTDREDVKIVYYEMSYDHFVISDYGGEYNMIHKNDTYQLLRKGLSYSIPHKTISIELPENNDIELDIKSSYGDITLVGINTNQRIKAIAKDSDIDVRKVNSSELILSTSYGKIEMDMARVIKGIEISGNDNTILLNRIKAGSIDFNTKYSKISMEEVQSVTLVGESKDSGIVLNKLSAEKIVLSTTYGNIKGSIKGNKSDYAIVNSIKDGKSNLEDSQSQSGKSLDVKNYCGDIEIEFVGN